MEVKNNQRLIVSVLFIFFSVNSHVSIAADTISANQFLSGDQTIVSGNGVFELGFFKPGNSSNLYIGMWYKKLSEKTIVWVANRGKPVSDRYSSELRISNGNLVLFNESGMPIWSTNLTSARSSSIELEAVLLDEGNLVLREFFTSVPLWQSFDNPTHSLLPGMKLGRNKRTEVKYVLTSWKNEEDPAPGFFSFEPDPDGSDQYVLLWNRSEQYWTSGLWNGQIFNAVPEMVYLKDHHLYNASYVSNENESYFFYTLIDAIAIQFVMDTSGQVRQMYWSEARKNWFLFWSKPNKPCEIYSYCGAFGRCNERTKPFCECLPGFKPSSDYNWYLLEDYSGGCVRKTELQCENNSLANRKTVRFLPDPKVILPKYPHAILVENITQCETTCLNDCSCTAYAYENDVCSIWMGSLLNLQKLAQDDTNGKTVHIKLSASEFSSQSDNKGTVIGSVGGTIAFILFLGLILVVYLRNRTIKTTKAVEGSLVAFAYKDLQFATKNFSSKLGEGSFGSVFKGVLPNSSLIAVKKLESLNHGEKEFGTEVSTLGMIQHINLVRLQGFCCEGTRRLLVYDFMANGSLDTHLFHEKESKVLNWETRYEIALGIARGLAYLHENCRDYIIHCDIKPENILLDAEFCPKVADFGLAKLVGRDFSRVLTTLRGTRGYLAPEWISGVAITAKADVYSYGMVIFEIVSGRRNSKLSEDGNVFFPAWAGSVMAEGGNVFSLLDPRLKGSADMEQLSRTCKVASWCIQDDETHRPSMGQVVQILEGLLDVMHSSIPKSLQVFADNQENMSFPTESSSSQSLPLWSYTSADSYKDNMV